MTETIEMEFSPGEFIQEELIARGWTTTYLARRMGGDVALNQLTVDMHIAVRDKNMSLDEETAQGLSRAFGVSAQFFMNLDRIWREGMRWRVERDKAATTD